MKLKMILLTVSLALMAFAQEPSECDYINPLDIPLVLSGTFGELRGNHFHSGIDIKTQGVKGFPVYAVGNGYISRIRVSGTGFGKAIYIKHPEGYTTVYAHLDGFEKFIADHVKDQQYRRESFAVDLYFGPEKFPVSQGQQIAISGNSGGSGGPHLHFEIRNSANEYPMNPLLFGIEIPDHRPPTLTYLVVEPKDIFSTVNGKSESQYFPLFSNRNGEYKLRSSVDIHIFGNIGFAIANYDKLDGAENRNGSYSIELLIDGKRQYQHDVKSFGFHETRYINSHITYDLSQCCGVKAQKCYLDPQNSLSMTKGNPRNTYFTDPGSKELEILVSDFAGNRSRLQTTITVDEPNENPRPEPEGHLVEHDKINSIKSNGFKFYAGLGSFYKDEYLKLEVPEDGIQWGYQIAFRLGDPSIAAHKYVQLNFPVENVPAELSDKILLVRRTSRRRSSRGGKLINGEFSVRLRDFGDFELALDTIAPQIRPLDIRSGYDLSRRTSFSFQIQDNLSGIEDIKAEVDGAWILMEYDPKNQLLIHYLDGRIEPGDHELVLKVWDERGNLAEERISFTN